MNTKIKNVVAFSILPQILLVKWLANYPDLIERYYSLGFYKFISKGSRFLMGWIPFSMGDIFYIIAVVLGVRYLIVKRYHIKKKPLLFLRNIALFFSVIYFSFHILWGFNYYRQPISKKLNLKSDTTQEQLHEFVEKLVAKSNDIHYQISLDSSAIIQIPYSKSEIFRMTVSGYNELKNEIPFLSYEPSSIKKSLFSTPLTYMGYGGYLNPFTNEAQVNAILPNFRFPVVSAHEIGHQIGYSAENETNFIGYLVTATHKDAYFKYAAYTYALSYCLSDIRRQDETAFQKFYAQLNPGIKKNFQEMNDFWLSYENPMEPVFKSIFNSFLKANNQAEGIHSYNRVVSLMVAYDQKHPL